LQVRKWLECNHGEKITRRDHWITALSQFTGYYSSRCPSWLTKTALTGRLKNDKCGCFWSSRTGGSSSYLLLTKIFVLKQKSSNPYMRCC